VIEDPDVAETLQDKEKIGEPMFEWMAPEDVESALGSAEEAVAEIEAGEWDEYLAFLLVAERRVYGPRVTVIEAIAGRNRKIIEEQADEGDQAVISPDDIVTAGD